MFIPFLKCGEAVVQQGHDCGLHLRDSVKEFDLDAYYTCEEVRVNKKRVTIIVTSCPKPFTGARNTVLGKSTRVGADYQYVTVN